MIRIGTSGWQYPDFKGRFYPNEVPSSEMLTYYATRLGAMELNRSFYHFTRPSTFAKWKGQIPPEFEIAVKAHRSFTHDHRLADPEGRLPEFVSSAQTLGDALGPILFQIAHSFSRDDERLRQFLKQLPAGPRYVFELRHPSWHCEEVYALLRESQAAFCIFDIRQKPSPRVVTASFSYVRLHGPLTAAYRGAYPRADLEDWAQEIERWSKAQKDVYVFFDNTMAGDAIDDALWLQNRLGVKTIAGDAFETRAITNEKDHLQLSKA